MSKRKILAIPNRIGEDPGVIRQASWLARFMNAELHVQAVVHRASLARDLFHLNSDLKATRDEALEEARRSLRAELDEKGLTEADCDAVWAHPFDEGVMAAIKAHQPDMVVMSLFEEPNPSRAEWRVIRGCEAPLYLVRPRPWSEAAYVLACVDPTHAHDKPADLDKAILSVAGEVARVPGSTFHILHAAGITPELSGSDPYPDQYRHELEASRTAEIMKLVPLGWRETVEVHFTHTSPVEAIRAFVDARGADILVVGSLSRSWLQDLLIGGTVRDLLPSTDRDIILVRPPTG